MKVSLYSRPIYGFLLLCCLISNIHVSSKDSTQAPQFLSELVSENTIVSEGQTKIIGCQAIGHPQPKYKWLKDWQDLPEDGDGSFSAEYYYKIRDISKDDAGLYRCLASNSAGTILTAGINVSVAYMKELNESSATEVRVSPGRAARLPLPAVSSYPSPSVSWYSGAQLLHYDIKYAITDTHNDLIILDVGPDDVRTYSARITNTELGKELTTPEISLIVEGEATPEEISPSIIVPPANISIIKGTSISQLQCIANARPLYHLETLWYKDDVPIKQSGIKFFSGQWNRTLSLLDADQSYTGVYKCEVKLQNSISPPQVSAEAHVTVLAMPAFKRFLPEQVEADLGKVLMLPCEVEGSPPPFIRWFRNAVDVKQTADSRYRVLLNGSLAISSVNIKDAASFQCSASNSAGEISTYTRLKVKTSAPFFVTPPTNQTALDGQDAILPCHAKGAPMPNTTWFSNGAEIVETPRYQILPNGSLKLSGIQKEDSGVYKCVRANEAGVKEQSIWLEILVKTRIAEPPADVRVILGHVATLGCKVSHAPSVDVKSRWLHNGRPIQFGPHSRFSLRRDGSLEIQEARAADVGQYTCIVSSSGGDDSRSARLDVMELPYAPVAVAAEKAKGHPKTAKVSWTPTFDGNSPIISFIIFKRIVPSAVEPDLLLSWEIALSNVSERTTTALVHDLKPSTGYQFRVSAVNNVGEGPPSSPTDTLVLPQEAPSAPPRGLVGSPRSPSEIMIQWKAPMEDGRNGLLLGYLVKYRLWGYKASQWYFKNITKESQHNYLIRGLITWKDYEIQVAAYNAKGVGAYSDSITIKTKEGVPVAPPRNVSADATSSTVVRVMWRPPQPYLINGINQGYKLQAWKEHPGDVTTEPSKTVTVTPSPYPDALEIANITDLEEFTKYFITVLCFTHPGDGDRSMPVVVTTLEDVPDQVADLAFEEMSDRYVKVSWAAPDKQNGILKGYTVNYQKKDVPSSRLSFNLTADVTTLEIENITASTYYTFEVYAWTSVGPGESLISTIQSGVEPVLPDPPTRLAVSNIQPFSVVLQFTPGFDGNSSIDLWRVEAHTHRTNTWEVIQEIHLPDASSLTIDNLIPYSKYQLRLTAVNIVGASDPSLPSQEFQTLQANPAHPPSNMTVRAVSATELRVRWIPLQQFEWYGAPQGYKIKFRPQNCKCLRKEAFVYDITANSHQLVDLEEFAMYEVTVVAVNEIGSSFEAPLALERTRESVPSAGPSNVSAEATTSTTIVVTWGSVPQVHQNGIIEGYKVIYIGHRSSKPEEKVIENNHTFTTTLTELRKYYFYSIQVRAFTRQGDGQLSDPAILIQTLDDVPGPPSNVSFPDVSFTYARIRWDKPAEPNGEITAYSITLHLIDRKDVNHTMEFGPNVRTYKAQNLKSESNYMFLVRARTRLGWGRVLRAPVFTTNNRAPPAPPSAPSISHSQVTAHSITFTWSPGKDGFAPIRYYSIQYSEDDSAWNAREEQIEYSLTSYTVDGLKPYAAYRFRIQATNDIGSSEWSQASPLMRTLPAAPVEPPTDIKVIPITRTSVRVEWTPLFPHSWSGDTKTGGYRVKYRKISDIPTPFNVEKKELADALARNAVLTDLERDTNYEIVVAAYNAQGESPPSSPHTVYVGEAVPTGEPRNIKAEPVSPTEIHIEWELPLESERNGELLSCKIFYTRSADPPGHEEVEVVSPKTLSYELLYLDTFTDYVITLLCMNPAGEGPKSAPVKVRTLETIPGPVSNLNFTDITMNSLKVVWEAPLKPNGHIVGYLVTYETARHNENFSKQVKQKVATPYLLVQSLKEEVTYKFNVKAETKIGFGPEVTATVTTGPQAGSPARPKEVKLSQTVSSLTLHWRNSHPGDSPIHGYYIEAKKKDGDSWTVLMKTDSGSLEEYTVSFQNLLPATRYEFRLISYNTFGISHPSGADKMIVTPSKVFMEYGYLQQKPFYHETWFVVTLAMSSIVMIIIVVAVLCVKSKTYKYKQEAVNKTLEETLGHDDCGIGGFPAYEMQSRAGGTLSKRSTLNRSSLGRRSLVAGATALVSAKSPPRPAPASVTYSDDETVKGYDENPDDSSSDVTEKPTDISSTDSQATESDDNESRHSEPHSFVNHYANVNDTLRQSWKRQKPVRNYSSYTDSEAEGSAVMSLNGGQIIMNNMAGSRAPLPGFSSFV